MGSIDLRFRRRRRQRDRLGASSCGRCRSRRKAPSDLSATADSKRERDGWRGPITRTTRAVFEIDRRVHGANQAWRNVGAAGDGPGVVRRHQRPSPVRNMTTGCMRWATTACRRSSRPRSPRPMSGWFSSPLTTSVGPRRRRLLRVKRPAARNTRTPPGTSGRAIRGASGGGQPAPIRFAVAGTSDPYLFDTRAATANFTYALARRRRALHVESCTSWSA